jgi:hypothetical protein
MPRHISRPCPRWCWYRRAFFLLCDTRRVFAGARASLFVEGGGGGFTQPTSRHAWCWSFFRLRLKTDTWLLVRTCWWRHCNFLRTPTHLRVLWHRIGGTSHGLSDWRDVGRSAMAAVHVARGPDHTPVPFPSQPSRPLLIFGRMRVPVARTASRSINLQGRSLLQSRRVPPACSGPNDAQRMP